MEVSIFLVMRRTNSILGNAFFYRFTFDQALRYAVKLINENEAH